jgi:hypothetical protein
VGREASGAWNGSAHELREEITRVRALTERPFAVNFLVSWLDDAGFTAATAARPAVISLALGDPHNGDLEDRASLAAACRGVDQQSPLLNASSSVRSD